jgi:hypothetical protein
MYHFKFLSTGIGEIQIDHFRERFTSDHSFWSMAQYEEHWRQARQVAAAGYPARFITSITNPKQTNFIRTWVCYPMGGEVVFHEQILFLDQLSQLFDPMNPHAEIRSYERETEDGEEISEWRTCL